jgi:hypothetical protein
MALVPTGESPQYEKPILITKSTVLRTQVVGPDDQRVGFVATTPYEHHPVQGQVEGILMRVPHDNGRGLYRTKFGKQLTATLQCAMPNGTLRYTTDGQQPTTQSPPYTAPIVLTKSGVITARYFDADGQPQGAPWRRSFEQIDAETNLTTGKPVKASDVVTRQLPPENAVDGIVDRNLHWDASSGAPQWWQVDLESSHKLNRMQVITYWDGRRHYTYRIEVSLDGTTWQEVADHSQNTQTATSKGFMHQFDPVIARYIRVTMLSNSINPGLHGVEVRAFADDN